MKQSNKFFLCSNFSGFEDSDLGDDQQGMSAYSDLTKDTNIVSHLYARNFNYPEHQSSLSIKCCFGDELYIRYDNKTVTPRENNYLLLNPGTLYESELAAPDHAEVFSIFFSAAFEMENRKCLLDTDESNLSDPYHFSGPGPAFIEKLYRHDDHITPVINKLRTLTTGFYDNISLVNELYHLLMERLYWLEDQTRKEINQVGSVKASTKLEIYKRLHSVKDHLDSFYSQDICLDELARLSLMNSAYLLRQFKRYFKTTPYQYLIKKRMTVAKNTLQRNSDITVAQVCRLVGYADLTSFRKLFKKVHGAAPEMFQRDHRGV